MTDGDRKGNLPDLLDLRRHRADADYPPAMPDVLVPIEQSQRYIDKLIEAKVPAKLEIRKGKNHGWLDVGGDVAMMGIGLRNIWLNRQASPQSDP